ncbi:MAG: prepilin-type N-terminal cleavage/methylation domain-containing protein [Planctomycetota bacterium]|jgi:prepilin-type N-terminal cleavage/methylation domain-containing protein
MRKHHPKAGFTLFELILVLILLALAVGIVAPRALPLAEHRLDSNLGEAHAMARHARALAVTRGYSTRIHFDANDRRLWLEIEFDPLDNPGAFENSGDEWGQGVGLREGVEFDGLDTDTVTFLSDGTAEDAVIVLVDAEENRKALEIRGVTGLSRVVEGDEMDYLLWLRQEDR